MSVQMTGLDNTRRALQHVAREMTTSGVRSAVRAAGKVIEAAIESNAPEIDYEESENSTALPPGALKSDVHTKVVTQDDVTAAIVGPGRDTKHVAGWVEYGHRLVKGGRSKVLVTGKTTGDGQQIGTVQAYPYIRPAYEASIDEANAAFVAESKKQLEELS